MTRLTEIIGGFFDLLARLSGGSPLVVMVVVSVLTAAWALLLFKLATPQERLTRTRDRLFGHIYEMGLYQDRLRVVAKIQGDLARTNFKYLGLTLPALAVLTIPMVFTLAQLDARYAHRPFRSGETTVLSATFSPDAALDLAGVSLQAPPGVTVEAGPVRDPASGGMAWRLRAEDPGTHVLRVTAGGVDLGSRELVVADELISLGESSRKNMWYTVRYPGAPALPSEGELEDLTLRLPARRTSYLGVELPWLVAFMIFSLLAGLALKDVLRVSI